MIAKEISTNRHLAILNLFPLASHKSNQPLQIAITQWREKNYKNILPMDFYSFKKKRKKWIKKERKKWGTKRYGLEVGFKTGHNVTV